MNEKTEYAGKFTEKPWKEVPLNDYSCWRMMKLIPKCSAQKDLSNEYHYVYVLMGPHTHFCTSVDKNMQ